MEETLNELILIAGGAGALSALALFVRKLFIPFDKLKTLETENMALKKKIEEKEQSILDRHDRDIRAIQREQKIVTYGVLACLKGLKEKGCNGAVTKAIDDLEKYLNEAAHDWGNE